jgi:hypothetical protein
METSEIIETLSGVEQVLRRHADGEAALDASVAYTLVAALAACRRELEERWEQE